MYVNVIPGRCKKHQGISDDEISYLSLSPISRLTIPSSSLTLPSPYHPPTQSRLAGAAAVKLLIHRLPDFYLRKTSQVCGAA